MDFCIYNDIVNTICVTDKKLLHFELSKLGQNLHVDKTSFPRPAHISTYNKSKVFFEKLGLLIFSLQFIKR